MRARGISCALMSHLNCQRANICTSRENDLHTDWRTITKQIYDAWSSCARTTRSSISKLLRVCTRPLNPSGVRLLVPGQTREPIIYLHARRILESAHACAYAQLTSNNRTTLRICGVWYSLCTQLKTPQSAPESRVRTRRRRRAARVRIIINARRIVLVFIRSHTSPLLDPTKWDDMNVEQ